MEGRGGLIGFILGLLLMDMFSLEKITILRGMMVDYEVDLS